MVNKLRVASWNIWVYGPRNYKGIAKVVRDNRIDVIGLQEAAIYQDKRPRIDMAREIARELGYNLAFFSTGNSGSDDPFVQGNAVISRFPIVAARAYKLNPKWVRYGGNYETEQRILVASSVDLGVRRINFLTTHLQFSKRFVTDKIRLAQIKRIISVLKELRGETVLTGDFNSVPQNIEIRLLGRYLSRIGAKEPTWTVHPFDYNGWHEERLMYRLDNIFVSKGLKANDFKVLRSRISDHLPIRADIMVKK